jgi:hypothetical protein
LGSGPKRTQALTSIVELFSSLRVAWWWNIKKTQKKTQAQA